MAPPDAPLFKLDYTRRLETLRQYTSGAAFYYGDLTGDAPLTPEERAVLDQAYLANLNTPANPALGKTLIVMGGGPASGKSSTVARLHLEDYLVRMNGEDIRRYIPHFRAVAFMREDAAENKQVQEELHLTGADVNESRRYAMRFVYPEMARLSAAAYTQLLDQGLPVLVENHLNRFDQVAQLVAQARDAGYRTWLLQPEVDVPTIFAFGRARDEVTGKPFAPYPYLMHHKEAEKRYADYLRMFDETVRFYNGGPVPELIAYSVDRAVTVTDPDAFARARFKSSINIQAPSAGKAFDEAAFQKQKALYAGAHRNVPAAPDSPQRRAQSQLLNFIRLDQVPPFNAG